MKSTVFQNDQGKGCMRGRTRISIKTCQKVNKALISGTVPNLIWSRDFLRRNQSRASSRTLLVPPVELQTNTATAKGCGFDINLAVFEERVEHVHVRAVAPVAHGSRLTGSAYQTDRNAHIGRSRTDSYKWNLPPRRKKWGGGWIGGYGRPSCRPNPHHLRQIGSVQGSGLAMRGLGGWEADWEVQRWAVVGRKRRQLTWFNLEVCRKTTWGWGKRGAHWCRPAKGSQWWGFAWWHQRGRGTLKETYEKKSGVISCWNSTFSDVGWHGEVEQEGGGTLSRRFKLGGLARRQRSPRVRLGGKVIWIMVDSFEEGHRRPWRISSWQEGTRPWWWWPAAIPCWSCAAFCVGSAPASSPAPCAPSSAPSSSSTTAPSAR